MRSVLQLRASEDVGEGSRNGLNGVRFREPQIEMAHGAGGKATRRLIDGLIAPLLLPGARECLGDAAPVDVDGTTLAVTTDGFVVTPLRFPGGSIGELAVNGTVNDLAVSGATPVALVASFVIEAGLPTSVLEAEVRAMANAARVAGIAIVGGDTKVVEHGKADQLYITTTGVGLRRPGLVLGPHTVRPGDKIIVSGPIGDHGITILLARGELDLEADLTSDTRSVLPMVSAMIEAARTGIRWMRDPTRGGVATTLNELAIDSGLSVHLDEEHLPVRDAVRGACELLGLDPLHIANEGQFLAVVAPDDAGAAVEAIGAGATIIGEIRTEPAAAVLVTTGYGGSRIVDMLVGDPLPRIC
jgi:hydrogenase expression/formation protein HypE